ncbi:MAG: hypothetical protein ABI540_11280 [Spartobacteria bacterium]
MILRGWHPHTLALYRIKDSFCNNSGDERRGASENRVAIGVPVGTTQLDSEPARQTKSGGGRERGEFELPYLPRHATRRAWVTFARDPRERKLETRVLG